MRRHEFPVQWNDTTRAAFAAFAEGRNDPMALALRRFAADPGDEDAVAFLASYPQNAPQMRTTCVATMIEGGHAENALPQSASATVNCRIFPGVRPDAVEATLRSVVGEGVEVAQLGPAYWSDASPLRDDVMAAVRAAVHANYPGVRIFPAMSAGATDGLFFRAAGIPTYGVGEIFIKESDEFAHGLNERVPVESFYNGLTHWRVLITALAGPD